MATDATVGSSEQRFTVPDFSLEGKTAIVTGGSRGIGKAVALALAARGADVGLTCFTGCKFAEDVQAQIRDLGRRAEYFSHDVGNPAEVVKLAAEVTDTLGNIDILVNNAGITRDRSFKKMSQDMWDAVIAVNLTGVFIVTKQFIDGMADRGWGRVINVSSIVGEVGNFGQANYAAAKAGVIGLTKTLGPRVCPQGRDRQRGSARVHQNADAAGRAGEGTRGGDQHDAGRPARGSRGSGRGRGVFGVAGGQLHYRPRARRQWRYVHGRLIRL